ADATAVMALETELAKAQWSRVEARDATRIYNPIAPDAFATLAPGYDWQAYLKAAGVPPQGYIVVSEPSYLTGLAKAFADTPLDTLKAYFEWHVLSAYASYLPPAFDDAHFAFYGTVLQGTPQQEPRWERALHVVNSGVGFALGKLYVARYFPPAHLKQMQQLVENLRAAFKVSIEQSTWMDAATQGRALEKLAKFEPKIGYPQKWRDYSALDVKADDLVGNVMRANRFDYARDLRRLGHPIDRTEWFMTPQTVNAYYNPAMNEIVFPAAILQPPFFDPKADPAVNYGAIGAVIGHEMSHGFDDQGAKYDGDGNLDNWWTPETLKRFEARTKALIGQYDQFEALPGHKVNGALTIGENIADNAGLHIAYQAYHRALHGRPAPVIDGFTGDQRFFMGWAQVWRGKRRDAYALQLLTVDPHSPPQFRCNGVLRDMAPFYRAYGVKPGDAMYLPPAARVTLY
ncbi:MAG TPA: M13 family metallopeptidase, partial [Nevskiaceae bacterium]|nr:M13 family metallopeptidase [Nevskiaceae bacterium]